MDATKGMETLIPFRVTRIDRESDTTATVTFAQEDRPSTKFSVAEVPLNDLPPLNSLFTIVLIPQGKKVTFL